MDSLTVTIIFIALSALIGAFVKGRMRDKCFLNFSGDPVHIELKNGKVARGVLRLEATGLELKYKEPYMDKNSFILYKSEYSGILCVVRFMDELDDKAKARRERFLKSAYNRKGLKMGRRIRNFFATIRDTVMEVVTLLIGKVRQTVPMRGALASQGKYVSQMESGLLSSANTSFEPLLERHIGKKVILQCSGGEKAVEYSGILKGYTAEFLHLMDLPYRVAGKGEPRKADIIVPRSLGLIRHLGE